MSSMTKYKCRGICVNVIKMILITFTITIIQREKNYESCQLAIQVRVIVNNTGLLILSK